MARAWEVVQTTSAPIERVWQILIDARRWNQWGRFKHAELERLGEGHDDGVGAIRVFGQPPVLSREEVVVFEPNTHFAYVMLSGMPVNGYRADVYLSATETGTTIRWQSSFESTRPAWLAPVLAAFLRRFIVDTAKRLARTAETSQP